MGYIFSTRTQLHMSTRHQFELWEFSLAAGSGRLRSNRESSASLNHWLGVERAPEPRRDDKHVIQAGSALPSLTR